MSDGIFGDVTPDQWQNLTNFGFSTMAAAQQPGAHTLGAIGQGGIGMNQAALQRAQTQDVQSQVQSRQLQNQLMPYQIQKLKNEAKLFGALTDDDQPTPAPPPNAGGQPWSPPLGSPAPSKQSSARPVNNPGNLRPVGSSTGFQTFDTPQAGMDAMRGDLLAKVNGSASMNGQPASLRNIIYTYAPPSENNSAAYLENVSKQSGIPPNKVLTPEDIDKILPFMVKQEGNGAMLADQQPQRNIGQGIPKPSKREMAMGLLGMGNLAAEQYKAETAGPITAAQEAAKTAEAGPKKEGEDTGTNKAAAQKTLNVITSNLPIALKRFQELRDVAKDTSFGMGVEGKDNEPGWKQTLAYQLAPYNDASATTANANTIFGQKTAQGVLPELGPSLAQAGIKGNKFLETLANEASGLNMAADPKSKLSGIQGLEDQYIRNLKSTAQQVRSYGGNAPTDREIDEMVAQMKSEAEKKPGTQDLAKYKNPKMIGKAYQAGEITKEQATQLLQQNHGFQ